MRTALNAPEDALDPQERVFVSTIRDHGWVRTEVDAEEGHPGFSYTTGLWVNLGFPEVIVFSLEAAHDVLRDLIDDVKAGTPPVSGVPLRLFANLDGVLLPVAKAHYAEHLGWSRWFYGGDEFACLQLVWPDRQNLFPWQPGADPTFSDDQPDLSEEGWTRAFAGRG